MAHGFSNRVWCDTATTGTGNVTIGAARGAHCTPADAGTPDGADRTWLLEEGNDFEVFRGAYTATGAVVTRGTVLLSQIAGVVGTTRMTLGGAATIRQVVAAEDFSRRKKNYIVNGAMMVSQENGTTAGTTSGYYPVDQFSIFFSNAGTQTAQQVASVTPEGSPNRLRVTCTVADASIAAGDYCHIEQKIEGNLVAGLRSGSASAKTVTIRFGVKAPAGTYGVSIRNKATNRSRVAEYVISAGEANTSVVKSVTIPLDQSGTWNTDNTTGFVVNWNLMCGSTYQTTAGAWQAGNFLSTANQYNFMGTASNVFELFDVAMYEGDWFSEYEFPDFDDTLRKCQRYWAKSYDYPTAVGTAATVVNFVCHLCGNTAATSIGPPVPFPVPMRDIPAVTIYSYSTGAAGNVVNAGTGGDVAGTVDCIGRERCRVYGTATIGIYFHWRANARL